MARVPSPSIGGGRVGASDISVVQTRRQNIDFSPLARGLESQADDGGLAEGFDALATVTADFAKQQQATEEETEFGALKLELRKRLFAIENGDPSDPANATPGYRDIAGQNAVDGSADVIARIRAAEAEVTAKAQFERNKGRLATANGFSTLDALRSHSTYVNEARKQAFAAVNGEAIQEAQNAILGSFEPVKVSTANLIDIEEAARNIAINAGAVPGTEQGDAIIEKAITDEKTKAITAIVQGLIDQDRVKEATALFTGYKNSINPKAWGGLMVSLNAAGVKKSGYEILDKVMKLPREQRAAAVVELTRGSPETRAFVGTLMRRAEAREKDIRDEQDGEAIKAGNAAAIDPGQNIEDLPQKVKDSLQASGHWRRMLEVQAKTNAGVPLIDNSVVNSELWNLAIAGKLGDANLNEPKYAKAFKPETLEKWRIRQATQATTQANRGRATEKAKAEAGRVAKARSATVEMREQWSLTRKQEGYFAEAMSKELDRILQNEPDRTSFTDKEYLDIARGLLYKGEHYAPWYRNSPNMSVSEAIARGMELNPFVKRNQRLVRNIAREVGLPEIRTATLAGRLAAAGKSPTPATVRELDAALRQQATAKRGLAAAKRELAADEADAAFAETPQDMAALAAQRQVERGEQEAENQGITEGDASEGDVEEVAREKAVKEVKAVEATEEVEKQKVEVEALKEAVVEQEATVEEIKSALDDAIVRQRTAAGDTQSVLDDAIARGTAEEAEAARVAQARRDDAKSVLDDAIARDLSDKAEGVELGASISAQTTRELDTLIAAQEAEAAKLNSLLAAQQAEDDALQELLVQQEKALLDAAEAERVAQQLAKRKVDEAPETVPDPEAGEDLAGVPEVPETAPGPEAGEDLAGVPEVPETAPASFSEQATRRAEVVKRILYAGEGDSGTKGNFPPYGSGLTYGQGVDMQFVTEGELATAGATRAEIAKFAPYIGKKERDLTAAQIANVPPMSSLVSDALAFNKIQVIRKKISGVTGLLSGAGIDRLVSLRYWAGALGNIKNGDKLVVTVNGKRKNFIWEAIKDNKATDADLAKALKATKKAHTVQWKKDRIQREIDKLGV